MDRDRTLKIIFKSHVGFNGNSRFRVIGNRYCLKVIQVLNRTGDRDLKSGCKGTNVI
jgi:hypothetical protein